jgi:pimeloyl-ACP methyl ester carboxylesterase
MYSSGASDKIFILAFDYRGFGKSTGTPSESGLLRDAEAVVDWALNVANIPPDRIVLLGHSLGTAVATAITHHYMRLETPIEFAGLILCAAFTNCGNAFSSYSIGGVFPVLAPVKLVPAAQSWFSRRMKDTWFTDKRLASLVCHSSKFRLVFVHAQDDGTMPWDQTEELFRATIRTVTQCELTKSQPEASSFAAAKDHFKTIDLGEAGRQEIWKSETTSISKLIALHGG